MTEFIHLPGIGNSGNTHWQSRWEEANPAIRRFTPRNWDKPDLSDWMEALDEAVRGAKTPPVLVAHSLACLLVAHWHPLAPSRIKGAFLAAVPDPLSSSFPADAAGFADVPEAQFGFRSLIVASTNDPYGSLPYAEMRARQWGSELKIIGAAGHINGQSDLGDWPEGLALLTDFANQT
ncbi:hypothetical protein RLEG12_12995 [Rhizobium leguminosarum bv. trifolii CB782]|nr:hypothetical protein RLEG12_12995 [Rhizobium leguminosarum bv. trifolii CB782]